MQSILIPFFTVGFLLYSTANTEDDEDPDTLLIGVSWAWRPPDSPAHIFDLTFHLGWTHVGLCLMKVQDDL